MRKNIFITIIGIVIIGIGLNLTADEDYKEHYKKDYKSKSGVAPITNKLYKSECASCHFGYQAGLLPSRSWKKLMEQKSLENHFKTDASLEEEDRLSILNYLVENSAEKNRDYKRSYKINRSIPKYSTPIAVTKTPYFIKKHDEIPSRLIEQKDVKSLSNCMACHTIANKGYYGERSIKIPNYGYWDD